MNDTTTPATEVPHDFEPFFDDKEMYEIEESQKEKSASMGIYRRMSPAVLTKSSDELRKMLSTEEDAEPFLSMVEDLPEAINYAEQNIEIMKSASARLIVILSQLYDDDEKEAKS